MDLRPNGLNVVVRDDKAISLRCSDPDIPERNRVAGMPPRPPASGNMRWCRMTVSPCFDL
jgi:hypothetical protein